MRIIIEIDGQILDLPEDLSSFPLTFALKDRSGVAINSGARSEYSFSFPATKKNNSIFARFWNLAELNQEEQKLRPAFIEVDGLPYFQGKAQLTSATASGDIYSRRGGAYNVAFYGTNIDWVAQIKDVKLYEYSFNTHIFDNTTIFASFANSYPVEYSYNWVKYKDWGFIDRVQFLEASPMINVRSIIDNIFNSIGYSLTSAFFETDYFKRLYIPLKFPPKLGADYSEDYLSIKGETIGQQISLINPVLAYPFTQTQAPALGPNPYTLGEYQAPGDGFYRFRVRADLYNIVGSVGFRILIALDFAAPPVFPAFEIGDQSATAYNTNTFLSGEIVLNLTQGQRVGIIILADTTLGDGDADLFLEVDGETPIKSGSLIDFKYILPKEWGSLDLIKGLSHAFNLVWQTNPLTRSVIVEPSDSYNYKTFAPSTNTIEPGFYVNNFEDKSLFIDLDKEAEVKSLQDQGQALRLSWKYEGETEEAVNNGEDLKFLQGRYIMPAERYNKEEQTIENPFFYATLEILDNSVIGSTSQNVPQFPFIWSGNYLEDPSSSEEVETISPRLLYKEPYINNPGRAEVRVDDPAAGPGFVEILAPLAYMVDYNNASGLTMPLSFGDLTINGVEQKGLLSRFYLADFKRREIGKELEEFIFWGLLDVQNLNFKNKILIKDSSFILSEINSFNVLSEESTKTYLLYDAQLKEEDSLKVESSTLNNKING
jgi:hypothetical protein